MQPVIPPSHDQLRAVGQRPLIKLEINIDGAWLNICDVLEHVIDGGLEYWLSATDLKDWTETLVGTTTINRESSEQHGGNHCIRFDVSNVPDVSKEDQVITLEISTAYELSFWYKHGVGAPAGNGGRIWFFGSDYDDYGLELDGTWRNGDAYDGMALPHDVTTWTKITIPFTTNAVDTSYTLRIRPSSYGAGNYSFYVDDISIVATGLGAGVGGNYLENASVSLGGASMTPDPIGGSLSVTLSNKGSIFHPLHPTSGCEDYIKAGRKVRLSIGAMYADVPYYWQRIIGYIDEPNFEMPSFKVNISGADYMKLLEDVELREPIETQWRLEEEFNTFASDGRGTTEYYTNADAMDIALEANDVDGWWLGGTLCTLSSIEEATEQGDTTDENPIITGMADTSDFFIGGYVRVSGDAFPAGTHKILEIDDDESITLDVDAIASVNNVTVNYYVGKIVIDNVEERPTVYHNNVFDPDIGQRYNFTFHWKAGQASAEYMRVIIYQWDDPDWHELARREGLGGTMTWTEETLTFIAQTTDEIQIWIEFYDVDVGAEWYLDLFTIRKYTPPEERHYVMPDACNGIYRVLLDEGEGAGFEDVWQGEEDIGYYYTEEEEFGPDPPAHPPKIVWFDKNRKLPAGPGGEEHNLKVQYFITVSLVNMVADILVTAGLYADRAAALVDIEGHPDWADPNIDIDKCWFKVGEPALGAIKMICERANYRFFFTYEGKPALIPALVPDAVSFAFTEQKHIASVHSYQDRSEIWNRIIIEGSKRADPVNLEESRLSEFRGEVYNQASIDTYGERTLTIKNHLFQDQTDLDAMCATLLAEYKDPKWYADIEVPFNPVPLELRDKITWLERLSPIVEITQTGITRDIKIDNFNVIYKCQLIIPEFLDDFCAAVLGDEWTEHGKSDDKTIELNDTDPCYVTISILNDVEGRWWCNVEAQNKCPKIYMPLGIEGPCRITTKLNEYVINDDTMAGIFIGTEPEGWGPADSDLAFLWGRFEGINFARVQSNCGSGDIMTLNPSPFWPMWLQIRIDADNKITFWTSHDGTTWQQYTDTVHGWTEITDYDIANSYVGLFAKNINGDTSLAAPFEFFRIDNY